MSKTYDIDVTERLTRLETRDAIETLIGDLARAFDAGPCATALRPLFSEDASFVIDQYGTFAGRDAIADGVAGNAETGFRWTLHYLVSPQVRLDHGGATAAIDFMLWEVARAASDRAYFIGGRYSGQAIRVDGDWMFERLELRADLISRYEPGWSPKPATLAAA